MIRVVNKKKYNGGGYYIGRPSPLGNPYSHLSNSKADHVVATREESIEKYEEWLIEQLESDTPAMRELTELVELYRIHGELTLICWCSPKPCHGDILARFITDLA